MTDETQDQVEELEPIEEPKRPKYYFTVKMGLSEAQVEIEEDAPSLSRVLGETMGIKAELIFLDEVWVDPGNDYWSRQQILTQFHVGPNSKAHLKAVVHWTRY